MSNFEKYAKMYVTINGSLLTEESSCKLHRNPGLQRVDTVGKGFAGMSQGSPSIDVTIENAVPSAGFELDPGRFMLLGEVVELTLIIPGSGLQLVSKGFITEDDFSHAVNSESKLNFTFLGAWSEWE